MLQKTGRTTSTPTASAVLRAGAGDLLAGRVREGPHPTSCGAADSLLPGITDFPSVVVKQSISGATLVLAEDFLLYYSFGI